MRIAVTVVIDMTDEQLRAYAAAHGLPEPLRAKNVVDDVQPRVLAAVRDSSTFGETGDGHGARRADVTLKR